MCPALCLETANDTLELKISGQATGIISVAWPVFDQARLSLFICPIKLDSSISAVGSQGHAQAGEPIRHKGGALEIKALNNLHHPKSYAQSPPVPNYIYYDPMTDSFPPTMLLFLISMVVLPAVQALPLNLVARNPGIWPDASNTDYLVASLLPRDQVF